MKKILNIIWKDTLLRFSSITELLFFLILPIVFTLVLAGGTGSQGGDNRIRLLVADQAHSPLSTQIIAELGKSGTVRPDVLNLDKAPAIALQVAQSGSAQKTFNVMAYLAPGMALMFLMFTVSNGGRSILAEQMHGTLPRLLVSPTNRAQILVGKIFGVYVSGVIQMLIETDRARRCSCPTESCCSRGSAKAAVLPVPVCAKPRRSCPASSTGMARTWMGVGSV